MSEMPDATTDDLTPLFVYGSLMPGQANFPRIEKRVHGSQPGHIRGVLVDLGPFPALVPGDGIVQGVVLKLDEAALVVTDRIESYEPAEAHCLYVRREAIVTLTDNSTERAWTYFFARPEKLKDRPKLIVGHRDGRPVFAWPPKDSNSLPNSAENESES